MSAAVSPSIDAELCESFAAAIDQTTGPDGGKLEDELDDCAADFTYLRGKPSSDLAWRRNRLIGMLRHLLAKAAVDHLEPDLVILDEFQRFKDLLDADDDGAQLAKAIFDHPDAKVLLLSATPYKMYTLPDEPEGTPAAFTPAFGLATANPRSCSCRPARSASRITGTKPADPTRFGSSKTAVIVCDACI